MKKFRISLGVLLQQNYEIEIEAENEEEAIKLGIEAFRDGDERGEIVDFDGAEAQENFDEDTKIGISAEEVDKQNQLEKLQEQEEQMMDTLYLRCQAQEEQMLYLRCQAQAASIPDLIKDCNKMWGGGRAGEGS